MQTIDLPEERRQHILEELRRTGKVVAAELSQRYSVSEDTIRRDLRELADAGMLKRVHGGALPISPATGTYLERTRQSVEAKVHLAEAAAQLVRDGQVILFGGGTTNTEIAHHLPPMLRAMAITISPLIALTLASYPNIEVVLIGGRMHKRELVTADAEAIRQLRQFNADLGFLGICSLHPEMGITGNQYEDIALMQTIIEQSGEVATTVTAEKLGTVAPYQIAPLHALTHLIAEAQVPAETLAVYREHGVNLIIADKGA